MESIKIISNIGIEKVIKYGLLARDVPIIGQKKLVFANRVLITAILMLLRRQYKLDV